MLKIKLNSYLATSSFSRRLVVCCSSSLECGCLMFFSVFNFCYSYCNSLSFSVYHSVSIFIYYISVCLCLCLSCYLILCCWSSISSSVSTSLILPWPPADVSSLFLSDNTLGEEYGSSEHNANVWS